MPLTRYVILKDDELELYYFKNKLQRRYSLKNDFEDALIISGNDKFLIKLRNQEYGEFEFHPYMYKKSKILIYDLKTIIEGNVD